MRVNGEHEKEHESADGGPFYEFLDAGGLAGKLQVTKSWVREWSRSRCPDPIPYVDLGRYKRYRWGSPELNAWLRRRMKGRR
jgi:hypothetical protein